MIWSHLELYCQRLRKKHGKTKRTSAKVCGRLGEASQALNVWARSSGLPRSTKTDRVRRCCFHRARNRLIGRRRGGIIEHRGKRAMPSKLGQWSVARWRAMSVFCKKPSRQGSIPLKIWKNGWWSAGRIRHGGLASMGAAMGKLVGCWRRCRRARPCMPWRWPRSGCLMQARRAALPPVAKRLWRWRLLAGRPTQSESWGIRGIVGLFDGVGILGIG